DVVLDALLIHTAGEIEVTLRGVKLARLELREQLNCIGAAALDLVNAPTLFDFAARSTCGVLVGTRLLHTDEQSGPRRYCESRNGARIAVVAIDEQSGTVRRER